MSGAYLLGKASHRVSVRKAWTPERGRKQPHPRAWATPKQECARLDTFLALRADLRATRIIARALRERGCLTRHFLGQMCRFRHPPPGQVGRRLFLPIWVRGSVSACQHEL